MTPARDSDNIHASGTHFLVPRVPPTYHHASVPWVKLQQPNATDPCPSEIFWQAELCLSHAFESAAMFEKTPYSPRDLHETIPMHLDAFWNRADRSRIKTIEKPIRFQVDRQNTLPRMQNLSCIHTYIHRIHYFIYAFHGLPFPPFGLKHFNHFVSASVKYFLLGAPPANVVLKS